MKGNINGGKLYAGNQQGVNGTITTDGSGDGSVSLTFRQKMKKVPYSNGLGFNEKVTTGTLSCVPTQAGAVIYVDGCNKTSSTVKVGGIFYDDTYF